MDSVSSSALSLNPPQQQVLRSAVQQHLSTHPPSANAEDTFKGPRKRPSEKATSGLQTWVMAGVATLATVGLGAVLAVKPSLRTSIQNTAPDWLVRLNEGWSTSRLGAWVDKTIWKTAPKVEPAAVPVAPLTPAPTPRTYASGGGGYIAASSSGSTPPASPPAEKSFWFPWLSSTKHGYYTKKSQNVKVAVGKQQQQLDAQQALNEAKLRLAKIKQQQEALPKLQKKALAQQKLVQEAEQEVALRKLELEGLQGVHRAAQAERGILSERRTVKVAEARQRSSQATATAGASVTIVEQKVAADVAQAQADASIARVEADARKAINKARAAAAQANQENSPSKSWWKW